MWGTKADLRLHRNHSIYVADVQQAQLGLVALAVSAIANQVPSRLGSVSQIRELVGSLFSADKIPVWRVYLWSPKGELCVRLGVSVGGPSNHPGRLGEVGGPG